MNDLSKIHVMHVIDTLAVGGAERMLVDIANHTDRARFDVSVCETRSRGVLARELIPHTKVFTLNRRFRYDVSSFFKMLAADKAFPVDIYHTHGRSSFAYLVAASSMSLISQPIILHDHYGVELDDSIPLWFRLWGRHKLSRYVAVYTGSARWARMAGIPQKNIQVIENAIELDRIRSVAPGSLRQSLGIPGSKMVGVFVGGIRPEKGLDILIQAVAQASARNQVIILVIGGVRDPDYMKRCEQLASSLGLGDEIAFLGERNHIPAVLKEADFGVVSSVSESGPLVLIEYLAAGLPIVATDVGEVANRARVAGIPGIIPAGDVEALAQAIDDFVLLSPKSKSQRKLLANKVVEQFDIRQKIESWHQLYETVYNDS